MYTHLVSISCIMSSWFMIFHAGFWSKSSDGSIDHWSFRFDYIFETRARE